MRCKTLTIFEGPDGSGKTTAAKNFAESIDAMYVHFPALPNVNGGLARMYVEAMLPALHGLKDVVFDRSWISESPYGVVFREGQDRLPRSSINMLERLAMRCGAVVVMCRPPIDRCLDNYRSRKHLEMLDNEAQLMDVYDMYGQVRTSLPVRIYNYTKGYVLIKESLYVIRNTPHLVSVRSAGNYDSNVALVGDSFGKHKDNDPFYQWPFASFSKSGCSQWLTAKLQTSQIDENKLFWVNADQLNDSNYDILRDKKIIALGNQAGSKLMPFGYDFNLVNHPNHQKRFHFKAPYDLITLLEES